MNILKAILVTVLFIAFFLILGNFLGGSIFITIVATNPLVITLLVIVSMILAVVVGNHFFPSRSSHPA